VYIYIYIYRERERERGSYCLALGLVINKLQAGECFIKECS